MHKLKLAIRLFSVIILALGLFAHKSPAAPTAPAALRVDNQNTSAGSTLVVPIRVDTVGNETGYGFSIAFDSTKLTNPSVVIGNVGGDVLFNANNPGQVGISVLRFSSGPIEEGGPIQEGNNLILVTVTFTVATNAPAGTTNIIFTDTPARRKATGPDPNFPITQPTYTGGTITIGAPTAANVSIGGRVTTEGGRGISNVRLSLIDSQGNVRTATSTAFGYYRFNDVEAGQTYIVGAISKRYTFSQPSQALNVTDDMVEINFTGISTFK